MLAHFHSHSRKQGGLSSIPATSKSTRHHIEEIQCTLSTPNGKPLLDNTAIMNGRGLLKEGSTHPPTLSYTRTLRRLVTSGPWGSVCTLSVCPKTHPTRPDHLLIVRMSCDDSCVVGGVAVGVVKLDQILLAEFDMILQSSGETVLLKERREWWGARNKLDKQLKVRETD